MKKRMEQLKFMADLNWRLYSEKFDKVFVSADFIIQFNHFLATEVGQKWLKSENGQRYIQWQES